VSPNPEELQEIAARHERFTARLNVQREAEEWAIKIWKALVAKVGESEAKDMMRRIMGDKKPGPPDTDESIALKSFIGVYLLHQGKERSDGEIARHIFDSDPRYVQHESGAVNVVNNDYTEEFLELPDDPVIRRWPIDKNRGAIEKIVKRQRRWAVKEYLLSKKSPPKRWGQFR
jgi:hypothetical protein